LVQVPLIDDGYAMGIHLAICKHFHLSHTPEHRLLLGTELWQKLDAYFMEIAQEAFQCAPHNDNPVLVLYIISTFHCYSAQARYIETLLHHYNEVFVNAAKLVDSWLTSIKEQYLEMEDDYLCGASNAMSL